MTHLGSVPQQMACSSHCAVSRAWSPGDMRNAIVLTCLLACSSSSRPPPRGPGAGGEGGTGGSEMPDGAAGTGGGGAGGVGGGGAGGGGMGGVDAAGGSGVPDAARGDVGGNPDVGPGPYSVWVYPGGDGRLVYKKDDKGNQVPDFSNAGYMGGGVALPRIPDRQTLSPAASGDDGARIQAALDAVGAMPVDASGFRGAVLLEKGTYRIAGTIAIKQSGVVLRGQGQGADGTVLLATGAVQRTLVQLIGSGTLAEVPGTRRQITDDYVPVGARSFHLDDASGLAAGDTVVVQRPSTQEWIDLVGMDACAATGTMYDTDDQNGQTCLDMPWTPGSKDVRFDRVISGVEGNLVTVDAPIVAALEKTFGGGSLYKYTAAGRISQSGVENLRGDSEFASPTDENHGWTFIQLVGVINGWVRDITAVHYGYAAVLVGSNSKWLTIQDSTSLDQISVITGGRRYPFNIDDSHLVLFQRCRATEGRHSFVEGSTVPGPNVFLDGKAENAHDDIGPHHRWSVGALYDRITSNLSINVRNRGNSGSGHGWAGANMVIWNSKAASMNIANPPSAQNWCIGCQATRTGNGNFDSLGTPVWPPSLYLQQLQDRLGPAAVDAISR
jgi:hypothetical protein